MQHSLLYFPIHTHGFAVLYILGIGATWSFVSQKLAEKLPATIQTMMPFTITLPTRKTLVATLAISLDILINGFIYI